MNIMRKCNYCGCNTNANIRRCCNAGQDEDRKTSKMKLNSEIEDCVITKEEAYKRLLDIEAKLAARFGMVECGNVRAKLIEVDILDELEEDELVRDWYAARSMWQDGEGWDE